MSLGQVFHRYSAVSDPPPNGAFHEWNSPRVSVVIRMDVEAARRLASVVKAGFDALPPRGLEVGGLLLGRFTPEDRPTTVIEDFEPIESEHRRGPSYTLSEKDRRLLEKRLRTHANLGGLGVVGYWRSHTRPGLYLDQEDYSTILTYFTYPSQVFLLAKPSAAGQSMGGFFFWEEGDIRRESPYEEFRFDGDRLLAADPQIMSSRDRLPTSDQRSSRPAWPERDPAGVENPERRSHATTASAPRNQAEDAASAASAWASPSGRFDLPSARTPISEGESARLGWQSPDPVTPGDPADNISRSSTPDSHREPASPAWPGLDPARVENPEWRSHAPTAPDLRTQAEGTASAASAWASLASGPDFSRERATTGRRKPMRQAWAGPDVAMSENPSILRDAPAARSTLPLPRLSAKRWPWLTSAAVLLSVVLVGAVVIRNFLGPSLLGPSLFGPPTTPATQPAPTAAIPQPARAVPVRPQPSMSNEFSLNVEPAAHSLRLWWNRDSPVIQDAPAGVLWVTDGARHLRVDLDKRLLSSGSIVYVPTQGDVEFDLEVPDGGRLVRESVRALMPAPTAPAAGAEFTSGPRPSVNRTGEPAGPQQRKETARMQRPPAASPPTKSLAKADVKKPFQPPAPGPGSSGRSTIDALAPPPVLAPAPMDAAANLPTGNLYDTATITYEPVRPPALERVFQKLPGLRRLQRNEEGKEFVPPKPLHELAFLVPTGTGREEALRKPVSLKVILDESGKVTRVEQLSNGPMTGLAAHTALAWQFTPARWKDKPVASEVMVHLRFGGDLKSTAASAARHSASASAPRN
jgi:hypothetical protein